ncbi:MAG: transporter substrate-binding protein [SAR324 cluster bacterium]|nr:transporter substrate-binding protein [SAR324 cluster bacterium]
MRKKMTRRNFVKSAAATLGVASAGVAGFPYISRTARAAGTVNVGSLLPKTGVINIYGNLCITATELAVQEINAQGGLLGKELNLIQYDTQSDIAKYPQFARKLILEDEVVIIHGAVTSAAREAVRPVINEFEQLYFYNINYEGGVCDKDVFVVGETPFQKMGPLARLGLKDYGSKCYTIGADYNFGHISWKWWDIFWRNGGGMDPVAGAPKGTHVAGAKEFIPLNVTDFNSTINRIQEANPDIVMSFLVGGAHINFYRQFAAAGLKDRYQVMSTTFGNGAEHIVLDGKESEGIIACHPYFDEVDNPANRRFRQGIARKTGDPNFYIGPLGVESYVGWWFWAKGVQKAGTFEKVALTQALESGIEWDSPMGRVKIHGPSHHTYFPAHLGRANNRHGFDIMQSFPPTPPQDTIDVCDLIKNPNQHTQYQPS